MKLSAYRPCPGDIIDGSIAFQFCLYDVEIDDRVLKYWCYTYYVLINKTEAIYSFYSLGNPYGSSGIIT